MTNEEKYGHLSDDEIKDIADERLCGVCPFTKGEVSHSPTVPCEGSYCDDAIKEWLMEVLR